MSRKGRPFMLPPDEWNTQFNIRTFNGKITQLPLKKVRQYTIPYSGSTMLELCNVPTVAGSVLIGLTENKVKRIELGNARNLKDSVTQVEVTLNVASSYLRYGSVVYNDRLFFVNTENTVKYTDGSTVTDIGGTCPRGRFVEVWFDHLVVGGPIFPGQDQHNAVAWSDLNNWSDFVPYTDSEADGYIFTDYQRHMDVVPGVTGVRKLGNWCMVYTSSGIYRMQYTGLPRVVRVDPAVEDYGNGFLHGLASVNRQHYFFDWTARNFFIFNGGGVKAIGDAIFEFFLETLNTDPELRQRTWAYVDKKFDEIWWIYVSVGSGGPFDRAVVYNYVTGKWYAASVEDLHCFVNTIEEGAKTCDSLPGTADQLNGICDRLGGASGQVLRLWGGTNERLLQEEEATDQAEDLLEQDVPVLETGDEVMDGVQVIKEVSSIAVQAGMDGQKLLEVELSHRENVDDDVVFDKVGLWNPAKKPTLDLGKVADRVFRWRFHPLERQGNDATIFLTGVTNFTLRTQMPNATPVSLLYLAVQVHNGYSLCKTTVKAGTETDVSVLDAQTCHFEKVSGPILGDIEPGVLTEVYRIAVDTNFVNLVGAGPHITSTAITLTIDIIKLDGGTLSCIHDHDVTVTITYKQLVDAINAVFPPQTGSGSPGDPFIYFIETAGL